MTHEEIVMKLIGEIDPVGETNEDDRRFENLKHLTELTWELVDKIRFVANQYIGTQRFSEDRAGKFADDFLLEIKQNLVQ